MITFNVQELDGIIWKTVVLRKYSLKDAMNWIWLNGQKGTDYRVVEVTEKEVYRTSGNNKP